MNNRKSNPIVISIVIVCILITYWISGIVVEKKEAEQEAQRLEAERLAEEAEKAEEERKKEEAEKVNPFLEGIDPGTLEDTLFIGDSRTVGIDDYGDVDEATYFADVGTSIFNVKEAQISVPGVGTTTLEGLLGAKEFKKIHVMLGYNEIGYDIDKTVDRNAEFITWLQEKQPTAVIIYQANLHIAEAACSGDVENNVRLDQINLGLRKLADGERVFYIDLNDEFDDGKGNLDPEVTSDGVHLQAKNYKEWCDLIREAIREALSTEGAESGE